MYPLPEKTSAPRNIRRHPYSVYRAAVERERRLGAKINTAFVRGEMKRMSKLINIFYENDEIKHRLMEMMGENEIQCTNTNTFTI